MVNSGRVVTRARPSTPTKLDPMPVASAMDSALMASSGPATKTPAAAREKTVQPHIREWEGSSTSSVDSSTSMLNFLRNRDMIT